MKTSIYVHRVGESIYDTVKRLTDDRLHVGASLGRTPKIDLSQGLFFAMGENPVAFRTRVTYRGPVEPDAVQAIADSLREHGYPQEADLFEETQNSGVVVYVKKGIAISARLSFLTLFAVTEEMVRYIFNHGRDLAANPNRGFNVIGDFDSSLRSRTDDVLRDLAHEAEQLTGFRLIQRTTSFGAGRSSNFYLLD